MLPDDREIMQKVLKKLADKIFDCHKFSPKYVAHSLEAKKMLTYDEYYTATISSSTPTERAQQLYLCLTKKGEQVLTVVKFYHCLLQSSCNFPPHYKLAQELRQWGMCSSLQIIKIYVHILFGLHVLSNSTGVVWSEETYTS